MKRFYFIPLFALTMTAARAQSNWTPARQEIHDNILLTGSNLTAYIAPTEADRLTPAPKGYEPFYLSHYGRHGSRWLTSDGEYTSLLNPLRKAQQLGKLTPKGEELLAAVEEFYKGCNMRMGDLTTVGERQHHGIGRRMTENFPEIFGARNAEVDARSTVVIRCILSMVAECEELTAFNPRLKIHNDVSASLQWYLNAHDTPAVREAMSKRGNVLNQYIEKWVRPERFCQQLFNDAAYVRDSVDQRHLMRSAFPICANMQSHDDGPNLWPYFTEDECYGLWRTFNVQWYLLIGNAPQTDYMGPVRQKNLLQNVLETADTILHKKDYHGATLRFGHETVVQPLAALLELGETAAAVENLDTLDRVWANYRYFPMACNVQLVFYRPKKHREGDILVKALLNEHEVAMPGTPVKYPYYRWDDLKAYYWKKLRSYEGM